MWLLLDHEMDANLDVVLTITIMHILIVLAQIDG